MPWCRIRSALTSFLVLVILPAAAAIAVELALLRAGIVSGTAPWRIILLMCAATFISASLWTRKRSERSSARRGAGRGTFRNAVVIFGPAIVCALLVRTLVAEPFVVPTGSMLPTLQIGDHVYASKFDAGLPERGQIAVFRHPGGEGRRLIKRVVGLPGDMIEMRSGKLAINGSLVPRCEVGEVRYRDRDLATMIWTKKRGLLHLERLGDAVYAVVEDPRLHAPDFGPAIVPAGQVFMMGDNRDHSWDSRSWGGAPLSSILGRARVIWWSSGPMDEPLRLDRMGHVLDSPAEYGELIGPCLEEIAPDH